MVSLVLQVREKSSVGKVVIDEIAEYIQESYSNNESGIVYCFSRKECEQVCTIHNLFLISKLTIFEIRSVCVYKMEVQKSMNTPENQHSYLNS